MLLTSMPDSRPIRSPRSEVRAEIFAGQILRLQGEWGQEGPAENRGIYSIPVIRLMQTTDG